MVGEKRKHSFEVAGVPPPPPLLRAPVPPPPPLLPAPVPAAHGPVGWGSSASQPWAGPVQPWEGPVQPAAPAHSAWTAPAQPTVQPHWPYYAGMPTGTYVPAAASLSYVTPVYAAAPTPQYGMVLPGMRYDRSISWGA